MKPSLLSDALLLADAQEREKVGAYWLTKHVAVVMGVSVNTVQRMSIPRTYLETEKASQKPIARFIPSEVRAWVQKRSTHQEKKAS